MRADGPTARRRGGGAWLGLALLAAQAAALPLVLSQCTRPALSVRVPAGPPVTADGAFTPSGRLPRGLARRTRETVDDTPIPLDNPVRVHAGLHRAAWQVDYRGGFRRRVGQTFLSGPFQDPAHPPCGLTMRIGQRFLDDTIEPLARRLITEALQGVSHWSIGDFQDVSAIDLLWLALPGQPGVLHATLSLRFTRAEVRVAIAAAPAVVDGALRVRPTITARVDLENWFVRTGARVLSYLEVLDKDDEATRRVTAAVGTATQLIESIELPRLDLPGGEVQVGYCPDRPIRIVTGDEAAIPLTLAVRSGAAYDPILFDAPATPSPSPLGAPLALEADLNALNLLLHHLWASGALDDLLADEKAADLFNLNPSVVDLLTLRVGHLRFALPPVLSRGSRHSLAIAAELALELTEAPGATPSPARLFARTSFDVGTFKQQGLVVKLDKDDLAEDLAGSVALTCEAKPGVLTPCFADVLDAIIDQIKLNKQAVHAWVTARFVKAFGSLSTGFRLELPGASYGFRITDVQTDTPAGQARVRVLLTPVPQP